MADEQRIRERAHALWEAAGRPEGQSDAFWLAAERELAAPEEENLDETLEDSFPASDPPANTGITGPEAAPAASTRTTGDRSSGRRR